MALSCPDCSSGDLTATDPKSIVINVSNGLLLSVEQIESVTFVCSECGAECVSDAALLIPDW